ncbi:CCA tRNA nucleotidyltransferase [Bacillus sp. B15-48]|uniref:CCA tRNA nucleotidyltransferase n=1 Tax=Bacillus sp. B15-48 TaxID=1548601 RepID=UPI00193FD72D|nr:CCA tRNA nucleotidyltransferase [Bacillus sp. B15-48]MBM4762101.1 CCA tRNA nucleotidyltransferase [Bacillus sp. B15-48]
MLPAFKNAVPIIKEIEKRGFEAYFVGGAVRDAILGREIADVDIATSAFPEELKRIFPNTADVGIEHGTIIVIYDRVPYEITTFRSETGYSDYRRPDHVEFIRSLEEDLKRRDFTMNAIAMDHSGKLIDPYEGRKAILNKQIITVGNSVERFSEDALRMMRAIRFVSQLGFTIEENTLLGLKQTASLLEKIAIERKLAEFEQTLNGPCRSEAINILVETGLYQYLPCLRQYESSLLKLASYSESHLSLEEMWTFLLYHIGFSEEDANVFLRGWKLPVKKLKTCVDLLHWLRFRMENSWSALAAYRAGKETMFAVERLFRVLSKNESITEKEILQLHEQLPIKNRSELNLTGNDLLAWFSGKPGPWIKEYLEHVEQKVISGEVQNVKAEIREWLMRCNLK